MNQSKSQVPCADFNGDAEKPYHHGDLQQELLCAAGRLLEDSNVAKLSMRAVAKAVGVSHTAPYRHFKDKESLLAGIAGQGFQMLSAKLATATASLPNDPAGQLLEAGYAYVELALSHPQCTQLMFSGILPCDDTYPELKSAGQNAFQGLKTIIEEGQRIGIFKTGDIELLSLSVWSGIHGLTLLLVGGNLPEILSVDFENRDLIQSITRDMLEGLTAH
jgi:AcrR family transcriptional regulator